MWGFFVPNFRYYFPLCRVRRTVFGFVCETCEDFRLANRYSLAFPQYVFSFKIEVVVYEKLSTYLLCALFLHLEINLI